MFLRVLCGLFLLGFVTTLSSAQDSSKSEKKSQNDSGIKLSSADTKPVELDHLKSMVGTWDAEFEVWPQGPEADSVKFKGVETNRLSGDYWVISDLESEVQGQSAKIHSIIGYDPIRKKLVGLVIDQGVYPASMQGTYDTKTKSVDWETIARDQDGKKMIQKTKLTQINANERHLVLSIPEGDGKKFKKLMKIRFVKRK